MTKKNKTTKTVLRKKATNKTATKKSKVTIKGYAYIELKESKKTGRFSVYLQIQRGDKAIAEFEKPYTYNRASNGVMNSNRFIDKHFEQSCKLVLVEKNDSGLKSERLYKIIAK